MRCLCRLFSIINAHRFAVPVTTADAGVSVVVSGRFPPCVAVTRLPQQQHHHRGFTNQLGCEAVLQ